ncbi:hypothetical protein ABB30_14165 [Stenotrophomonas ginsengisoli]|uniref:Calcineurin-like phosphoesterase domain-containing protein n=1 Tax=Stenotrophomonas ginsengisoli TaxID=336566 RepID=A0A0R0CWV0_9GAMM|nr:metallophosphoesterase [Stenotrophomonas ginsengisoli]KRG74265.1 hypothetical protein ABB30_14165 [Stenotrophomonas ginsengisoli]
MRMLLVSLILPLLVFALWWPLGALSRGARWRRIGISLLPALLLPLLIVLWRADLVGYATVSWLQLGAGWLIVLGMLLLLFVLLRTLGWGLHAGLERVLRCAPGIGLRRWHAPWLTNTAVLLAAVMASAGIYNGLKLPQVRHSELAIAGLPEGLDGLRIAVLADLHITPAKGRARTQGIVERTLAAQPDLIVLPGDMVDGPVAVSGPMVAPLAGLQAPLGVWASPGNHEVYHDYADWMAFFASLGLPVLENRTVRLQHQGAGFTVSGLGDLAARRPSAQAAGIPGPELAATLAQVDPASALHLMLVHQPKLAREVAASGQVDLQLSGHTHGGHIIGMDRWLVAPANDGFVRDAYRIGEMTLFVSGGAGQWDGFTPRLGIEPRIDLITLRRQ